MEVGDEGEHRRPGGKKGGAGEEHVRDQRERSDVVAVAGGDQEALRLHRVAQPGVDLGAGRESAQTEDRTGDRSAQCEVLNVVDGVARESRRRWYCPPGPAGLRVCTQGDIDEDGDRESPDALAGGTDCDDTDPRRGRRQVEAPDGIDNDCDGVIDEGVWMDGAAVALGAAPTPVVTFAGSVRSDGSAAVAMTSGDGQGALARSRSSVWSIQATTQPPSSRSPTVRSPTLAPRTRMPSST